MSLTISANGATQTVQFRQTLPNPIEWTTDNTTWTALSDSDWPVTVVNTNPTANSILKILFTTDITLTDASQYFAVGQAYTQWGKTSVNPDGSIPRIIINGVADYPGFLQNGTSGSAGGDYTYMFNLQVDVSGSTLLAGGGWVGQSYFGNGRGTLPRNSWVVGCKSNGPISQYSGGIIGSNAGYEDGFVNIIGCSSTGNIDTGAGGIIGYFAGDSTSSDQYINITSCWSSGSISGSGAGGILAKNSLSTNITSCYSTGDISGTDAGGIVGSNTYSVAIQNCYSTGVITGSMAGGIAGGAPDDLLTIQNCYSSGTIAASSGGIAGSATNTTLSNCYTSGAGSGTGGIIAGSASDPTTCYSEANNGSAGWSATHANTVLTGVSSGSWTIVGTGPYLITRMGYTPYAMVNILLDISGNASLNRTFNQTIAAGGTTVGPTYLPGYTYAIAQITPAAPGITINSASGALSASLNTPAATYVIWVYASINPYSITPYNLTVIAGPPQQTTVPWCKHVFPAYLFPQRPNSWYLMARTAWDLYENVQATDAATRVSLSGTGWAPPSWRNQSLTIWYVFQSGEEKKHFNLGQRLHQQAYPQTNWVAQRNLGISDSVVSVTWPQPL